MKRRKLVQCGGFAKDKNVQVRSGMALLTDDLKGEKRNKVTHNNKKIISVTLLLLLFVLIPFYCGDLKMEGIGSTFEDARSNARSNLAQYINGVFVQSSVMTSTYDDSVSSSDFFSSSSNTTSSGYLKAVEYINEYNKGTEYYSTAVIKDNSVNINAITEALKTNASTIETLYNNLSKQNTQQKKNTLITIYGTLTEYDAYKTILIYMGHGDIVPALKVNVTTTSIFIEYQNLVIEEGYALEEKEKYITDETEHQKLLEELSANRSEQRKLEREKNDAIVAREEASKIALEERLKQYSVITKTDIAIETTTDEARYASMWEKIMTARQSFLDACTEYDKLCKEQFYMVDKDYEAEKAAVEARPYRYAELNGSEPTPAAKKIRDDEIAYLYSRKELNKVFILKQIRASLVPGIRELYDEYDETVKVMDGECFEVILGDNTIEKYTTSFDSINFKWTITIAVTNVEGVSKQFSFTLTYKQLSGEDVKQPRYLGQKGYDEYMAFLDDIDYLDTVIRSFTDSFRITLKFNTAVSKESYGIGYEGIDIKNIQFILESNALNDPDWSLVVDVSPNTIDNNDLTWTLPGYSRIFNKEFDV